MKKYFKKFNGFTLAEALITMVIIGAIALLSLGQIKIINPQEKGFLTLSQKMAEYLEQATTEILLYHSSYDDFTRIKLDDGYFSIEDKDAIDKMAKLYRKYMSNIDMNVDLTNEYFTKEILNYKRKSLGIKLKDTYSNFFFVNDGMLMGLKFYGSCNSSEPYATPPDHRESFQVDEICGSIFYDINAFKDPNKLGSDQFILPIYKRGIKYSNDD